MHSAMEPGNLTAAASMESLNSVSTDNSPAQVRTLFVSGLPMDAKPRELYLLFRAYHGYENSLLKMTAKNGKPTSPVGFVTFVTRQDADEARKALQGVRFDPDCAQTIRLELARSNTKVSRPKQSPPPTVPMVTPTLPTVPHHFVNPLQHDLVLEHIPMLEQHQLLALAGMPHLSQSYQMPLTTLQQMQQSLSTSPLIALAMQQQQQQQHAAQQQQAAAQAAAAQQASACSTLFVANLGQNVNDEEMRAVFKSFPGFCRIRMHTKGGTPVAFVEYCDVRSAANAMSTLQGFTIPSSDRGGLRIEYARNKMADVNG